MKVEQRTGVVRLWRPSQGYGFLALDDKGRGDVFLHITHAPTDLKSGEWLQFVLHRGPDGRKRAQQAQRVTQ
jgi:cold shock CspA family protein